MFRKFVNSYSSLCQNCAIHSHRSKNENFQKHLFPLLSRKFHQRNDNSSKKESSFQKTFNDVHWYQYALGVGLAGSVGLALKDYLQTADRPSILSVSAASPPRPNNPRVVYNFIADVVENVSPAVVFIQNSSVFRQNAGSGFIVSSDGLIVTNAHVVQSARHGQVQVQLSNGKKYSGEVQAVDSSRDLALVKIHDKNLPTIRLASSETLRPGEWVVAVGSPLSLSNTVTSGIVSSTGRSSSELGLRNDVNYIQTDAPITFGNSGGPLINLDGEAVGVNSMKVTEGISFAIPSDDVKKFLQRADNMKKEKATQRKLRPPYIGVATITLSPHLAAQLRNRADIGEMDIDRGVFVVDVNVGSPAHLAGIQKYDIIIKVDNSDVQDYNDLVNAIRDKNTAKFTVYRQGSFKELHVKPRVQASS